MKDVKAIWQEMLSILEVEVHALAFDVWIKPLRPVREQDGILVLGAGSAGAAAEVTARYLPAIKRAMRKVEGSPAEVIVVTEDDMPPEPEEDDDAVDPVIQHTERNILEPKFNFEEFISGPNSELAYVSAQKVAQLPGKVFNPLFIYGAVGLGKTHLMQAIGNELRVTQPHFKILYVSMLTFVNEFIASLRGQYGAKNFAFREKYRNVDLLMVDDVQFLSGKKETQNELFHLFEDLKREGKQMVFTSDRPPKAIPDIDDRISSRFASSMVVDINPPGLETRIAILQKKSEDSRNLIGPDELTYIAERVTSNVREMEGVLTKVLSLASLYGRKVNMDICCEALKDYIAENSDEISVDEIIECTCKYFHVSKDDVVGKRKNKELVVPRQVAIYVITELAAVPVSSIGSYFGGREHTTMLYARDKIASLYERDSEIRKAVNDIKAMVKRQ